MKKMDNINKTNIKEGTISFWTKPNQINFSDGKITTLLQIDPQEGSIFVLKDSDNKIKFFHVYLGKGRTDVELDVSKLDSAEKHMFTFTWSVKNKELNMYVDGKLKSTVPIKY